MKLFAKDPDAGMATVEFNTFIHRHNMRMMRIVLGIFLGLDVVFYVHLGAPPGGILDEGLRWMIPSFLALGVILGIWLMLRKKESTPAQEYVFIAYILGSRLFYGSLIGFQVGITSVYVGLMLLLSSLFFFGRRIIMIVVILQIVLHLAALSGQMGHDTIITLMVTDVFAVTSIRLCMERYRTRLQAYLMNRSILETNNALKEAHDEISLYSGQMSEQLKLTREAEAMFKGLLENTDGALVLVDMSGKRRFCNDGLFGIIGYRFEDIDDRVLDHILDEETMEKFERTLGEITLSRGSAVLSSVKGMHRDGSIRTARIKMTYMDIDGAGYTLVIITDITEEVKRREELEQLSRMKDVVLAVNHRLSEDVPLETFFDYILSRVREVMPHADLGCILLREPDDTLIMAASFGYNQEESSHFRLPLKESFAYRVTEGNYGQTVIINNIQSMLNEDFVEIMENKDNLVVQSSISGPIIKDKRLYGFINIDSKDNNVYKESDYAIMEYLREQLGVALSQREQYREHAYLSKHDQLTGFLNRWYLKEIESDLVPRWKRYGDNVLVAAMDLNDLKKLNDRLGHHEGDAYILIFSACMQQTFRGTDIMIRLGGDEFAGIYFNITETELAEKLNEVNSRIAESYLQEQAMDLQLGFGYGISRFGEGTDSMQELLQIADARMYTHKAAMKAQKAQNAEE